MCFPLGDFANLVCRAPEGTKGPRLGGTRPRKRGSCFTSSRGSSWSAPKSRPRSSLSRHSGSRRKRNSTSSIGQSTIIPLLFFLPPASLPLSYELHVSPAFHRCGLGRKLAQMLFNICEQRGLDKVMLTVFKGTVCRNRSCSVKTFLISLQS